MQTVKTSYAIDYKLKCQLCLAVKILQSSTMKINALLLLLLFLLLLLLLLLLITYLYYTTSTTTVTIMATFDKKYWSNCT